MSELSRHALKYRNRRAAGLCVVCGAEADGRRACPACDNRITEWRLKRQAERRAAGLCIQCGKAPAHMGRRCCFDCLLKNAKRQYTKKHGEG